MVSVSICKPPKKTKLTDPLFHFQVWPDSHNPNIAVLHFNVTESEWLVPDLASVLQAIEINGKKMDEHRIVIDPSK